MKCHTHGGPGYVENEMGKWDNCDMEAFGRPFAECSEETIAIPRDRL